jgi:uracil-DNA glycosylase
MSALGNIATMLVKDRTEALAALLAWYRAIGVDQPVGETAVDWLSRGDRAPGHDFRLATSQAGAGVAASRPAPRQQVAPRAPAPAAAAPELPPPPQRQFSATPPDAAVTSARALAGQAGTLAELEATLAGFDGCSLKVTAKSLCFFRGAPKARLMLIGEAPGRDEDLQGKPFVGRAGQLLDRMLAAIGLAEADVHITNIVYWRPPGNRTPTPQEAQVCRPFLERQVELVSPEIVLLLGGAAAKHIFDVPEGIMRVRGKFRDVVIGSCRARGLATLHPAYLLRTPAAKRLAWRDLLAIKAALAG